MSEESKMDVLNWIPQVKSNNISIQSANRMKPRLLTTLKSKYISTKEDNFKSMVSYFKILEANSLNLVNKYRNDKGITETSLPFFSIMLMIMNLYHKYHHKIVNTLQTRH